MEQRRENLEVNPQICSQFIFYKDARDTHYEKDSLLRMGAEIIRYSFAENETSLLCLTTYKDQIKVGQRLYLSPQTMKLLGSRRNFRIKRAHQLGQHNEGEKRATKT